VVCRIVLALALAAVFGAALGHVDLLVQAARRGAG
jgi:hypothetical protein